ncbi:MAG: PorV/PorQ family protein [candidate division Zixibacteria bacterium]|nr:PorV/PorQ family protein [candidate division Zixibacteria bacterium]
MKPLIRARRNAMRRYKNGKLLYGIALSLIISVCFSTNVIADGAGSSAAEFLNIGAGSRAIAMGGAYSAIANDPSACYWNPAALTNVKSVALMLQHNEHYMDLQHEYAAYGSPIGKNGALGFSVSYLHMGSIMGYDANDAPTREFKVYDIAYGLSYGHKITDNLSLGLGAKNIRQSISDLSASGWAFDLGMLYDFGRWSFSFGAANLGSAIKYENESFALPTEYRMGVGYHTLYYPVVIGAEYGYSRDGTERMAIGAEYSLMDCFALRSGFRPSEANNSDGNLSFGCGLKMWGHSLDYTYLPNADLGATHRISAVLTFSDSEE